MPPPMALAAAVGDYPHTAALKDGRVQSDLVRLDFTAVAPISRAFAPMVRDLRFDVCEMAIASFLQARASDVPLVLLPIVLAARFQQSALLCRADGGIAGPGDLAGRSVGVRAYSQTTGMWLRGILAEEYGVRPEQIQWVTFEDAHVRGIADPPWAVRAQPGQDLVQMLKAGALDAVIVGNDVPDDPALRTVFADAAAAADQFWGRHHLVPVNHMVIMRGDLARERPGLVREVWRMFDAAAALAPEGELRHPAGQAALRPALALALRYMGEQGMLPRPLSVEEAWAGLPEIEVY